MTITKAKLKEYIENNKADVVIGFLQSKGYDMEKFMPIIDFKIEELEAVKTGSKIKGSEREKKRRILYGEGQEKGLMRELVTLIDVYFDENPEDNIKSTSSNV